MGFGHSTRGVRRSLIPHSCYAHLHEVDEDLHGICVFGTDIEMHNHSPSWFVLSSEATADIRFEALIPAVLLTALATCIITLRWYSRLCATSSGIQIEDSLVTIALVCIGVMMAVRY